MNKRTHIKVEFRGWDKKCQNVEQNLENRRQDHFFSRKNSVKPPPNDSFELVLTWIVLTVLGVQIAKVKLDAHARTHS